ncbi:MAG: hypothetical protein E4H36_12085 [Spirochaetales bacterium]|nr:MAG: hypothetical protein E4H36_12085 [Spirochaetales bacterium]
MRTSGILAIIFGGLALAGLILAGTIFLLQRSSIFPGFSGNNENFDESRSTSTKDIGEISIKTASININIQKISGTELTIRLHGTVRNSQNVKPELKVSTAGGKIAVSAEWPPSLILGFSSSSMVLDVQLPESFDGEMAVRSTSGNIEANTLRLSMLDLETSSGNIKAELLSADNLTAHSTSGNIIINDIEAEKAEITSTSGNTRITSGKAETYRQESRSGTLWVGTLEASEASLTSTSGGITVDNAAGGIKFSSTSGNVRLSFSAIRQLITGSSTSGNVTLTLPGGSAFVLDLKTASGSLKSDFPITTTLTSGRSSAGLNRKILGTVNNGETPVTVESTSGNISIREGK